MKRLPLPARAALPLLLLALAGCSFLVGRQRDPVTLYAPQLAAQADPSWPQVDWQLAIARPNASRMVDSPRIGVQPVPGELQVYRGVAWAQPAPDMVESSVLRVLEDSGKIAGVGRLATGMRSDYRLLLDLRRFESDYAGNAVPAATIEISATVLDSRDQRIVARRTFRQAQPAAAADVASVAQAFDQALAAISAEIAGWTLAQGQGDRQAHTRPEAPPHALALRPGFRMSALRDRHVDDTRQSWPAKIAQYGLAALVGARLAGDPGIGTTRASSEPTASVRRQARLLPQRPCRSPSCGRSGRRNHEGVVRANGIGSPASAAPTAAARGGTSG